MKPQDPARLPDESLAYLALSRAFPDRANDFRAATDRWAWLAGRAARRGGACALCARSEVAAQCTLRETFATSEGEHTTLTVCVACTVVLRELLDAPEDDLVLAELKRACPDDEALVERMETMAHSGGERPRRGQVPCDLCQTDDEPRLSWDDHEVCVGCLRDGARPARILRSGPTTSAEARLIRRL